MTAQIDLKTQIKGLQDSIKTLSGMGIDTTALETQLQSLQSGKVKEEFFSKIKGMGKSLLDSGIKVITLNINDTGELSVIYGTLTKLPSENAKAAAKPLLYIKGESPIMNKGQWFGRVEKDIKAIYKSKTDEWIKENREEIFKELIKVYPDKYAEKEFIKPFSDGPLNEELIKA